MIGQTINDEYSARFIKFVGNNVLQSFSAQHAESSAGMVVPLEKPVTNAMHITTIPEPDKIPTHIAIADTRFPNSTTLMGETGNILCINSRDIVTPAQKSDSESAANNGVSKATSTYLIIHTTITD